MTSISICNHKGGSGKTTSAINIAAEMGARWGRVLLIDMDPQGAATVSTGVFTEKYSMANVMLGDIDISEIIQHADKWHMDIAPSSIDLATVEQVLSTKKRKEYVLRDVIRSIARKYDYIIIDSSPMIGILTINAIVASNIILVPVQCEFYALHGFAQMMRIIKMASDVTGVNPEVRIFVTMATRTNLCRDVVTMLRERYGSMVMQTIIPRSIRLAESPALGIPIFDHDPESPGAIAYKRMVNELWEE